MAEPVAIETWHRSPTRSLASLRNLFGGSRNATGGSVNRSDDSRHRRHAARRRQAGDARIDRTAMHGRWQDKCARIPRVGSISRRPLGRPHRVSSPTRMGNLVFPDPVGQSSPHSRGARPRTRAHRPRPSGRPGPRPQRFSAVEASAGYAADGGVAALRTFGDRRAARARARSSLVTALSSPVVGPGKRDVVRVCA